MNKQELLALDQNAGRTVRELIASNAALAKPVTERLQETARSVIATHVGDASDELRKVLDTVQIPIDPATADAHTLRAATVTALKAHVAAVPELAANPKLQEELTVLGKDVPPAEAASVAQPEPTLAEAVSLDVPIALNPAFRADLAAARLYRVSDATHLGDATAQVLVSELGEVGGITDNRLATLVEQKKLSDGEARAAGAAASLYYVLDERPELVAAVAADYPDPRRLVALDKDAWTKRVTQSGATPPAGLSASEYGSLLQKKVERLFPTDALAQRLGTADVANNRGQTTFISC